MKCKNCEHEHDKNVGICNTKGCDCTSKQFIPSEDNFEKDIDFLKRNKVQDRIMAEKGCGDYPEEHKEVNSCPSCSPNHSPREANPKQEYSASEDSVRLGKSPVLVKDKEPDATVDDKSGSDIPLCDKRIVMGFNRNFESLYYLEKDVKEFILRLKEELTPNKDYQRVNFRKIEETIDKLSGDFK